MHIKTLIVIGLLIITISAFQINFLRDPSNCENFDNQNACQGDQTNNDQSWEKRAFQTPPRGDELWRQSYQDYNRLVGYPRVTYSDNRNNAQISVQTRINPKYQYYTDSKTNTRMSSQLKYFYNESESSESQYQVSSPASILNIRVQLWGEDKLATLTLQPLDFIWNHPKISLPDNYKNGQKGAIVQMFGWPYEDIAKQCQMLGKAGYLGVKVYPPQQSILDFQHPQNGQLNPWYWLYQPISYKFYSRMGTPSQLRQMINKCRQNNVRVYADAVVNHMVGNGNDMFPNHCSGNVYWGNKNSSGGSPFWSQGFAYQNWNITGQRPGMEMPSVPYGPNDFHCARSLNSWTDGFILNYGWLVNLADLNTQTQYVRQRIADYFTDILAMGFSGFRIDAAKHISPTNLAAIFKKLKDNLGGSLPQDFITYLEVIIGGEKDLLMCQDNPYNYGHSFENLMRQAGLSDDQIYKVKIWESDYPKEFPLCDWPISPQRYAIQLQCHDDQFPGSSSRDMGDAGSILVKEKNIQKHRNFQIQMLTRTDANWQIKLILSSYTFIESRGAFSFPDGNSDCQKCVTDTCKTSCSKSMPFSQAHNPDVCGYTCVEDGQWKQGVYTRVHRDYQIIKSLRQFMGLNQISAEEAGLPSKCG